MLRYALGRILQIPLILLAIYTGTFILCTLAPGDPLYGLASQRMDPEIQKQKLADYGYDLPVWQRYFRWLGDLARLDLGRSFSNQEKPIADILAQSMPYSMLLGASALVLAVIVGTATGALAAVFRNGPLDYFSLTLALVGISLPSFVVGAGLIFLFCILWQWLPMRWGPEGDPLDRLRELILPAIALSLPYIAYLSRLMRSSMIEVLNQDYIRTARAKGCSAWSTVRGHALRNALLPVVSFLGPAAAGLLTGGFVVEKLFGIPGMANYFVNSVLNRDLRLLLVVTMIYSTLLVVFNLVTDLAYGVIDPRIRKQ